MAIAYVMASIIEIVAPSVPITLVWVWNLCIWDPKTSPVGNPPPNPSPPPPPLSHNLFYFCSHPSVRRAALTVLIVRSCWWGHVPLASYHHGALGQPICRWGILGEHSLPTGLSFQATKGNFSKFWFLMPALPVYYDSKSCNCASSINISYGNS